MVRQGRKGKGRLGTFTYDYCIVNRGQEDEEEEEEEEEEETKRFSKSAENFRDGKA